MVDPRSQHATAFDHPVATACTQVVDVTFRLHSTAAKPRPRWLGDRLEQDH